MTMTNDFERRIGETFARAEQLRGAAMQELADEMEERIHLEAAFERLAEHLVRNVLRPRLEIVARHFEGTALQHVKTLSGIFSTLTLPQTERVPAATTLTMGVTLDAAALSAALTYRLQIVPVLMEYEARDDLPVRLETPDTVAAIEWIERKLEQFVETCLLLERDPRYRSMLRHTDPVCGMSVHGGNGARRFEYRHQVYHFCSTACREKFEARPAFDVEREALPLPAEQAGASA